MSKINLIFPVAGEASRFGGAFKPFLEIGDLTFIETTYKPFLKWSHSIDTVYFICTEEQEKNFDVTNTIEKLIGFDKVKVIQIKHKTSGPYQTIREGIRLGNISGSAIICDCDHTLNVDKIFESVDGFDAVIPTWDITKNEWMNWSKVVLDNDHIKMICEKERISSADYVVKGIIGCIYFDNVQDKFTSNSLKYVSDCLQTLLHNNKHLTTVSIDHAYFYGDIDMLENYVNILRKQCSIFCDIDGVLIKHHPHSTCNLKQNKLIDGSEKLTQWKDQGHRIVLTTARSEKHRSSTEQLLETYNIPYDNLVMNLPAGPRILINDHKPSKPFASQANAVELVRDSGLSSVEIETFIKPNDIKIQHTFEGGSFADTYLISSDTIRKHIIKSHQNIVHYEKLKRQMDDLLRFNFLWPNSTPKVLCSRDSDFDFSFDMEYLDGYQKLIDLDSSELQKALKALLTGMKDNVYSLQKETDGMSWINSHIEDKIQSKFSSYRRNQSLRMMIDSDVLTINGKNYEGLNALLPAINRHLVQPKFLRPVHGDLTLENILWNGDNIKLIDMDGSDFFDAAELDLGKMCQSIFAQFNDWKNIDAPIDSIDIDAKSIECDGRYFDLPDNEVTRYSIQQWSEILNDSPQTVVDKGIFYMCMYFIRFVPFRMKISNQHGIFALVMAVVWLSKLLSRGQK